jgi:hypothetical protein
MFDVASSGNLLEVDKKPSNVLSEFVHSAIHAGVVSPLRGLAQIADHASGSNVAKSINDGAEIVGLQAPKPAEFATGTWLSQQLGAAVGLSIPFMLTRGVVKAGAGKVFGEAAINSSMSEIVARRGLLAAASQEAAISAATGLVYGAFLAPSNDSNVGNQAFYNDRLKSGATDAAVFGALGFSSPIINTGARVISSAVEKSTLIPSLNNPIRAALDGPVLTSTLAGLPAGVVAAEAAALQDGRSLPTGTELKEHVVGMAVIGGVLGTAGYLGAQREGSNVTNGRYLTDKLGLTEAAPNRRVNFRLIEGQHDVSQVKRDIASGATDAQARVLARPQIETVSSALLGSKFSSYGDAKTVILDHRSRGVLSPNELAKGDVCIATCATLDGRLAKHDVFPGRSDGGTGGTVWLRTDSAQPKNFSLSLDRSNPSYDSKTAPVGRFSEVALGNDSTKAPLRLENGQFDVLGKSLSKPGDSTLLALNKDGGRASTTANDTLAKIGISLDARPFIQIVNGEYLWRLNDRPMQVKTSYSLGLGDQLLLNGKTRFSIEGKTGAGHQSIQFKMEGADVSLRPVTANPNPNPLEAQAANAVAERPVATNVAGTEKPFPVTSGAHDGKPGVSERFPATRRDAADPLVKPEIILPNARVIELGSQETPAHVWKPGPRYTESESNSIRLTNALGRAGTVGLDAMRAILVRNNLGSQLPVLRKALSVASFGEYLPGGAQIPKTSTGDLFVSSLQTSDSRFRSSFPAPVTIFDKGRNITVGLNSIKIETPSPSGQQTLVEHFNAAGERTSKQYEYWGPPVSTHEINSRMRVVIQNGARTVAVDNGYVSRPSQRFLPPSQVLETAASQRPIEIPDAKLKEYLGQWVSAPRGSSWLIGFDKRTGEALVSFHDFASPYGFHYNKVIELVGEVYPVEVRRFDGSFDRGLRDATGRLVFDNDGKHGPKYSPSGQVLAVSPTQIGVGPYGETVSLAKALGLRPTDGMRALGGFWAGDGSGLALKSLMHNK